MAVYVDNDRVAAWHAEMLLRGNDKAGVVAADLRTWRLAAVGASACVAETEMLAVGGIDLAA